MNGNAGEQGTGSEAMARLEHAFVTIRDTDRSLRFYRAILPGWTVRWEGPTEDGHRWVHFGPPDPEGQPGYLSLRELPGAAEPDEAYTSARVQHLGFAHPDVMALEARLAEQGIEITDRVDDGRYRRIYVEDPDGNELEFVERLRGA